MHLNTHPVPDHIRSRITEMGGLAANGQPLFRIIWGGDRLTVIGGEWKTFDNSGNQLSSVIEEKLTVKYVGAEDRFIFEMWCPPENYGTIDEWERNHTKLIDGKVIHELGPYPGNGEYELVKVLETPKGRHFVPLTATICDALVAVAVRNRHLPNVIRMESYRESQKRIEDAKVEKRVEIINNLAYAWDGKPHSIMPANLTEKGRVSLK